MGSVFAVVVGVVTLLAGVATVVVDLRMPGRRRVGRWRDVVEVLLPLVGLTLLVVQTWRSLPG